MDVCRMGVSVQAPRVHLDICILHPLDTSFCCGQGMTLSSVLLETSCEAVKGDSSRPFLVEAVKVQNLRLLDQATGSSHPLAHMGCRSRMPSPKHSNLQASQMIAMTSTSAEVAN